MDTTGLDDLYNEMFGLYCQLENVLQRIHKRGILPPCSPGWVSPAIKITQRTEQLITVMKFTEIECIKQCKHIQQLETQLNEEKKQHRLLLEEIAALGNNYDNWDTAAGVMAMSAKIKLLVDLSAELKAQCGAWKERMERKEGDKDTLSEINTLQRTVKHCTNETQQARAAFTNLYEICAFNQVFLVNNSHVEIQQLIIKI